MGCGGSGRSGAASQLNIIAPYSGLGDMVASIPTSAEEKAQETQNKLISAQNDLAQMSADSQKQLLPYYLELFKNIELPEAYREEEYQKNYAYPLQVAQAKSATELLSLESDYMKNVYYPGLTAAGKTQSELLAAQEAAIPGISEYLNSASGLSEEESNRIFGKARERIGATYDSERARTGERFASVGGMNSGEYQKAMLDVGYKQASDERTAAIDQAIYEAGLLKQEQTSKAQAAMNFTSGLGSGTPQAISMPGVSSTTGGASSSAYSALPNIPSSGSYQSPVALDMPVYQGIEGQLSMNDIMSIFGSIMKAKSGGM